MRPGLFAPDNRVGAIAVCEDVLASMRPGLFAPDNRGGGVSPGDGALASMRPGLFAPDNSHTPEAAELLIFTLQ